jgi:hypothetical protein
VPVQGGGVFTVIVPVMVMVFPPPVMVTATVNSGGVVPATGVTVPVPLVPLTGSLLLPAPPLFQLIAVPEALVIVAVVLMSAVIEVGGCTPIPVRVAVIVPHGARAGGGAAGGGPPPGQANRSKLDRVNIAATARRRLTMCVR